MKDKREGKVAAGLHYLMDKVDSVK